MTQIEDNYEKFDIWTSGNRTAIYQCRLNHGVYTVIIFSLPSLFQTNKSNQQLADEWQYL
jgi:hypothetical protein